MTLRLSDIWDLAQRFVPAAAADRRLRDCGPRSWWPAHEIGHFLVATPVECAEYHFGIDSDFEGFTYDVAEPRLRYILAKELAATSISQRLLRSSGHGVLADEEIQYTDETTLECAFEPWCKRSVKRLLHEHHAMRLPTTRQKLEARLVRKARAVGTPIGNTLERAHP
jgi:hypothetical protein